MKQLIKAYQSFMLKFNIERWQSDINAIQAMRENDYAAESILRRDIVRAEIELITLEGRK